MRRRDWLKLSASAAGAAWVARSPLRALGQTSASGGRSPLRERLLADVGWRFHLGHANDPAQDFGFGQGRVFDKVGRLFAPSSARFDDSQWTPIDLPHDWAVDLPFENAAELIDFGCKPLGRNYPATSIGWYRKTFDIPAEDSGRRLTLTFDGVFRNATAALNGHLLGTNFSGYAPFRCDITDVVTFGGRNILVVRVDATEREGWFYEGAGIYRHVWLEKTSGLHVAPDSTLVTTESSRGGRWVVVSTDVVNETDASPAARCAFSIVDASGRVVGTASTQPLEIKAWDRRSFQPRIFVSQPTYWSPDTPALYRLITLVEVNGTAVDRHETTFGFRTIRFDPDHGFFLNGKRLELKGTCNHQDHAGVGVAVPDAIQRFRITKLKAMGCNAYRTAHNPPSPDLLDACDRLGMLVLDETRLFSSNEEGVSQLERMILRDRNHPSVFAWSIANEEWSDQGVDRGRRIAESLRRRVHALDATRPVTAAMDSGYENGRGVTLAVDVQGFNYQRENIDAFHAKYPKLPTVGTETASAYATRGMYARDDARGYVSAYDVNKPDYGATAEQWWSFYAAREFLAGGFVWTGFDYRGEPSPFKWPCISSHFGILDTCGIPKDTFHYYRAWWSAEPVLHLFPHWNWAGKEGQDIDVWCFTNLPRVELFLNDRSMGAQDVARNSHVAWKVPYAAGAIEVRGARDNHVMTVRRETSGPAAKIVLRPDRSTISADHEDVVVVEAQIVDAQGRMVPTANDEVAFSISGPGRIIGVGNGDPSSHEPDRATKRRAFNGLCVALVQATAEAGTIAIRAVGTRLEDGTAGVASRAAVVRPTV